MATPRRRTFSGAAAACLLGVTVGFGWVPANANQASATDSTLVAADACPVSWPALRPGPPDDDRFDGRVSVLVGGSLRVVGRATGAEGTVVVRGNAKLARDEPGPYRIGVTGTGSQVAPHPGSDMLVVGGSLAAAPGTSLEVGPRLDGDAVVGGAVADGTTVDLGGGTLDAGVAAAMAPYDDLLAGLPAMSRGYADRAVTGTAVVTETAITLTGDGTSDPQVFALDGAALGAAGTGAGRTLQVTDVPDGAGVVVNLTGPAVDLRVEGLVTPGGAGVDPAADRYFAELATHLLWNVPDASTVDIGGTGQLPGSLLVGSGASATTLAGAGTNGRVYVAGDLVHAGAGELHSYPYLRNPELTCGPDLEHLGTLTLDVVVKDPGKNVDADRYFEGTFACSLGGEDVTPGDGTWQVRARAEDRVLTERVPVGALCTVEEQLKVAPAPGWDWAQPDIAPAKVRIAKRDPRGFTVTNSLQLVEEPPDPVVDPAPPQPDPVDDPVTDPPATPNPDPTPAEPTDPTEPTPAVPEASPSAQPDDQPVELSDISRPSEQSLPDSAPSTGPGAGGPVDADPAEPPRPHASGPLTTTAPYTLRGAFVWGPLLLLSVLAMRLRFPWRYKRRRRLRQLLP